LKIVGYISSDYLKKGYTPHNIQNIQIRSFLKELNHTFLLSWTEYSGMCPFVFNSLLEEDFYDGICFYSIEQLFNFPEPLNQIKKLAELNIWIGFANEKIAINSKTDIEEAQRLLLLKSVAEGSREDLKFLWDN